MRAIVDEVVMRKPGWMQYRENPEYRGAVLQNKPKVSLKASKLGFEPLGVTTSLKEKFNDFGPKAGKCSFTLSVNGIDRKKSITSSQLRVLKALAMEQCNEVEEYSRVMASVFQKYVYFLITGNKHALEVDECMTKLETVLFSECKEFIHSVTGDDFSC